MGIIRKSRSGRFPPLQASDSLFPAESVAEREVTLVPADGTLSDICCVDAAGPHLNVLFASDPHIPGPFDCDFSRPLPLNYWPPLVAAAAAVAAAATG